MRFGLWYDFRNPPHRRQAWPELYRQLMDQVVWAEEIGFESVWLSEHHFTIDGYMPSVFPTLAALGTRTSSIRLGTAVCLAPLHHPLRLAEDAAVVDVISSGRLELGLAPGYRTTEFEVLGIPKSQRGKRTDETLDLLRAAWTGNEIHYKGDIFSVDGVVVQPTPVNSTGQVPIHIGGASSVAARRAARFGCSFMPDIGTTHDLHDEYRAGLMEHGHTPESFEITMNGCLYVCEDEETGWQQVEEALRYMYERYEAWAVEAGDAPPGTSATDQVRNLCSVGRPTQIIKHLQTLEEEFAPDRYIFWGRLPGMPVAQANRSLQLFADEVLPAFT